MHFMFISTGVLLSLGSYTAAEFLYWVDLSCVNSPQRATSFNGAVFAAKSYATRAHQRLLDGSDQEMKSNYQKLYKSDWDNDPSSRLIINTILFSNDPGTDTNPQGIAVWKETTNRLASNVRFYCDNDLQSTTNPGRWKLQADLDPSLRPAGYVPNAQRERYEPGKPLPNSPNAPPYQIWIDEANGVTTFEQGCLVRDGRFDQAITRHGNLNDPPYNTQPLLRSTITLCDQQLNSASATINALANQHNPENLANIPGTLANPPPGMTGIDALRAFTDFVLLHEFMHVLPFARKDVLLADGKPAYGWQRILALSREQEHDNADTFAFLGVLASLGDRGWRLSRLHDEWQNGVLVYDPERNVNQAKRGIRWMG